MSLICFHLHVFFFSFSDMPKFSAFNFQQISSNIALLQEKKKTSIIFLTKNLMCVLKKAGIKTINWTLGIIILWKVLMTNHYFPFHPLVFHLQTTHGALVSLKACHWPSCSNFAVGYTLEHFPCFFPYLQTHKRGLILSVIVSKTQAVILVKCNLCTAQEPRWFR